MWVFSFDTQCGFAVICHPAYGLRVRDCVLGKRFAQTVHSTLAAAVGAHRSILTIPGSAQSRFCGFVFFFNVVLVCVCLHASHLLSHGRQICRRRPMTDVSGACTHTQTTDWMTNGPRRHAGGDGGRATFPSERSAKPQATITLVPVCLRAAAIRHCCIHCTMTVCHWRR